MDETEVQVEIACWAQDHPEASQINWDNGSEPWVDFLGQRCTLHLGLGGLTWSIEVPPGYQTEIDPGDGKRKRLWEPLDYHDTVIVQSRSTPFHVSVVDRSNHTLELFHVLEPVITSEAVAEQQSRDAVMLQTVHDKFKTMAMNSTPHSTVGTGSVPNEGGKALRIIGNAYFQAFRSAVTLAEVLDSIYGLAKLYNSQNPSSINGPGHDAEDVFLTEEDDEHIFDADMTMKWSSITAHVNCAREACASAAAAAAAAHSLSSRGWAESAVDVGKVSRENGHGHNVSFSACSRSAANEAVFQMENLTLASPPRSQSDRAALSASEAVFHMENLTLSSPPGSQSEEGALSDTDDEYTFLVPEASLELLTDICQDSEPPLHNGDRSGPNSFQIDLFRYDSDSDKSDGSWEMPGFHNQKASSKREEPESPPIEVSWPWDPPLPKKARAQCRQGSDDGVPSKRMKVERSYCSNGSTSVTSVRTTDWEELQWCDIEFNPVSFSVECTLRLSEFMDNQTVATALGLALEHPLRVEIVPNKSQVDSLSWCGAVEVYVSQHSDWHNHISEEVCGLLCWVPDVVQTYFRNEVPALIRTDGRLGRDSSGEGQGLFAGLLLKLVRRLVDINAGGSCCVCGKRGDRPPAAAFHMLGRSLWPCSDNLCLATYATWEKVSSADLQERQREENSQLGVMEESMRDTFSFADRDALQSALELYGVSTRDMNYGQMSKALAQIELWNQKDPDTTAMSYPVFYEV